MNGFKVTFIRENKKYSALHISAKELEQRVHTINNRICWKFNECYPHCEILAIEKMYMPSRDEITMGGRYSCD